MSTARDLPLGVSPLSRGTVSVSGAALSWWQRLDTAVVAAAGHRGADDWHFPPLISADDLGRVDYFRSFPHLMTVPATLPRDDAAIERFTRHYDEDRPLPLAALAPVEHALLPAACYQVYPRLADQHLRRATTVTTRSTCFRCEDTFVPLRRQWAFTMREVLCVGTAAEVDDFLRWGQSFVVGLCEALGLRHDRVAATDPFFRPAEQGRYLYQRLAPVKHETVVDDLAIASVNRHHEHFGEAFSITRDGAPAHSGCLAFGLERWLGVVCTRWGTDPTRWPDPEGVVLGHV